MSVIPPDPNGDAFATIQAILQQYGLGSLADWAWGELVSGASASKILLDLYQQQAFKDRFPAIFTRQEQGLPPISPAEYIAYEDQARQLFQAAGFPVGFYDQPQDFTSLIAHDVSTAELQSRVQMYQQAAVQTPPEVKAELQTLYGIDQGGLAAYYADPDRALPLLQQQYQAATIASSALRQKYGQLSVTEAEQLAAAGLTGQAADQAFAMLGTMAPEFTQGLGGTEGDISREIQLAAAAGDQAALQEIQARAKSRAGAYTGGGQFASGQTGVSGLGSASR